MRTGIIYYILCIFIRYVIRMLFDELIVYFRVSREHLKSAPAAFNRRLYLQDGMIPKYTGYIPRKLNLYSSINDFFKMYNLKISIIT